MVLIPAGTWLLLKRDWVQKMVDAREEKQDFYFARFKPSASSMEAYLHAGPISDAHRILFMIVTEDHRLMGHLGIRFDPHGPLHIDNVMRLDSGFPQLMRISLEAVMGWAENLFPRIPFSLEVISTNQRAISLYERVGFREKERVSLRRSLGEDGFTSLVECDGEESDSPEEKVIMKRNPIF